MVDNLPIVVHILSMRILTSLEVDEVYELALYSLHNGLALLHKYTSTERQRSWPDPRDTITCDTTSVVDG